MDTKVIFTLFICALSQFFASSGDATTQYGHALFEKRVNESKVYFHQLNCSGQFEYMGFIGTYVAYNLNGKTKYIDIKSKDSFESYFLGNGGKMDLSKTPDIPYTKVLKDSLKFFSVGHQQASFKEHINAQLYFGKLGEVYVQEYVKKKKKGEVLKNIKEIMPYDRLKFLPPKRISNLFLSLSKKKIRLIL